MSQAVGHWDQHTILKDVWLPVVIVAAGVLLAVLPTSSGILLIGGSALALAALVHPEWALYALVFAVPFGSVRQIQLGGFNLNASEACVALVVTAWLARMVADRRVVFPQLPLLIPLICFSSALVLSWLVAVSLPAAVTETLKWLEVAIIYLFVGSHLDERAVRRVVWLMLAAGAASALLGVYQFFGRIGPEGFLWETPIGLFMRAYGTFEQPNPYAGYLGLVAPLAYGLWTSSAGSAKARVAGWRVFTSSTVYGGLLVLIVLAMFMTWSRGALIGFGAAFVVMSVVRSRRAAIVFLIVAFLFAALGAAQLLPDAITQRFLDFLPFLSIPDITAVEVNPTNFAIIQRLAHWTAGWNMWVDHPWLGIGIGNYPVAYSRYMVPSWPDPLGHAHNYYLNVAAEAGLLGLGTYLVLWVAAAWQVLALLRRESGFRAGLALGVLGVLVHLSTHNFVDNLWVHNLYLHVAILLGCAAALRSASEKRISLVQAP